MKRSNPPEPRRWKDLPAHATGVEGEIGAATRLVQAAPPADEIRLVQLAARAAREAASSSPTVEGATAWSSAWSALRARRRSRTTALVLTSVLVGGVAMAVSGRIIQRFQNSRGASPGDGKTPAGKGQPRRRPGSGARRVSGEVPTQPESAVETDESQRGVPAAQTAAPGPDVPGITTEVEAGPPPHAVGKKLALRQELVGEMPRRRPESPPAPESPAAPPPPPVLPSPLPGLAAPTEPPPLLPPDSRRGPLGASVPPAVRLNRASPPSAPRVSEAALVSRALGHLRREHDPLWALNDLAEHDRRFPAGDLRREAALARAEALLALNRDSEALAVLDTVRLESTDIDRRTYLARAELRAQDGRRPEAIADFDRVLTGDRDDELAARALYGRAVCRVRGGDLGGARVDFQSYVQRFPEGAHRAEVEKMLRRLGG